MPRFQLAHLGSAERLLFGVYDIMRRVNNEAALTLVTLAVRTALITFKLQ